MKVTVKFHGQAIEMSSSDNGRSFVGQGARGGWKAAIQHMQAPEFYSMLEGLHCRDTGTLRMVNGELVEVR